MVRTIETVVFIALIGLPYLFMTMYSLRAAVIIHRRGMKYRAILTALTACLGIGWILAVRGMHKRPTITDMDMGIRCPSCGSEKGYKEEKTVDTKTGADLIGILEVLSRIAGVLMCLLIIVYLSSVAFRTSTDFILLSPFLFLFAAGGYLLIKPIIHYVRIDKEKTEECYCGKCGFIWNKYSIADDQA